jgi:hypothetical protein
MFAATASARLDAIDQTDPKSAPMVIGQSAVPVPLHEYAAANEGARRRTEIYGHTSLLIARPLKSIFY